MRHSCFVKKRRKAVSPAAQRGTTSMSYYNLQCDAHALQSGIELFSVEEIHIQWNVIYWENLKL